ncbi:MAG: hypothetical protein WDW36_006702 [Sanguina aurantia]
MSLNAVAREVNECAVRRARAVRVALQRFASTESLHVCHLVSALCLLHCSQDRCNAFVVLWSRVVDRTALKHAYQMLTGPEQERVMERLGYWHVWTALGSPHNLYFNLKMSQPEQKDIARECVRAAVRESLKAKADSKAKGYGSQAQFLVGLQGNLKPVSIPEDDKMWSMCESNFTTMSFKYAPTAEQSLLRLNGCVTAIQRYYHMYCSSKRVRPSTPQQPPPTDAQQGLRNQLQESSSVLCG